MSRYIEKIYSKIKPELLLHQVIRLQILRDMKGRLDVSAPDRFLQLAILDLKEDQTFKPHRHVYKDFATDNLIANESWVVMSGKVLAQYYDIEGNNIIDEKVLSTGDITMTFENGGHNYKSLEKGSVVLEFKSGPYRGIEWDKTIIE